eukprot:13165794-Ditylum_brightwellii.AAC.1
MHHTFIANCYPSHHSVKQLVFMWRENCVAGLKLPHLHDVPSDGTEHQIILIENNKKKGSISNTSKYTKVSEWVNTNLDVIADILHKDEHKVQHACILDTTIKPLLE